MQKVASFPFTFIGATKMGKIYRPYAVISVFSLLRNKWESLEMIIDSGADYTLLPNKYAEILVINLLKDCKTEMTLGVGGAETVYQYKGLEIKIGNLEMTIPVAFLERNDVPALLGRLNCLENLSLTFQNKESIFEI